MRVSIVATSLDGQKPESKTILNMVNRIQNRNPGYSDNIFKNPNIENTINSIDGATALKLDEQIEIQPTSQTHQETSLDQMKEEDSNFSQEKTKKVDDNSEINQNELDDCF